MHEKEFLDSIDCCFPYEQESQWRALIFQGNEISANASFGVLEEISRKPFGNCVSQPEQLAMVEVWDVENKHPLAKTVVEAAKAIITDNLLPTDKALEMMNQVRLYPDLYCALNIIYFACADVEGVIDEKQHEIINFWNKKDS